MLTRIFLFCHFRRRIMMGPSQYIGKEIYLNLLFIYFHLYLASQGDVGLWLLFLARSGVGQGAMDDICLSSHFKLFCGVTSASVKHSWHTCPTAKPTAY